MRFTNRPLVVLALTVALGLPACSDDSNPKPDKGTDQIVYDDMGVDAEVPDIGEQDMVVTPDGTPLDGTPLDGTPPDGTPPDGTPPDVADDIAPPDGATTDTMTPDTVATDGGVVSGVCTAPTMLTMPGSGKLTVTGDTTGMTNEFSSSINCGTSYDYDGQQVYYQVALTGAQKYVITVTPTAWDAALYLFQDKTCTAATINTECGGTGGVYADEGYSGDPETVVFTPAASGDFLIGVDSYSATAAGPFTLTIEKAVVPANDTCPNAKVLSFTAGKITETGSTVVATNDVQLTSTDCTGDTTSGPDVFYSVDLTAGKAYKVKLDGSGFDEVLYLFTSCTNVAGTCGTGMGADAWSSTAEEIAFTPTTTGTYYIGVAGNSATDFGSFTLTVKEVVVPANDTCPNATALTLVSGTVTVTGDTSDGTDAIKLTSSGCTGYTTSGFDVFYSVSLTAGTTYTITVTPEATFDPALYVFTDCANAETTCGTGWGDDSNGAGVAEVVTVTPTTSGTYYIGVDSFSLTKYGTFSLEIK